MTLAGFGPHYAAWDRPRPARATPCPEPDASPIVPTIHRAPAPADLAWRFTRGECVDLRAIPIERTPGGGPPDTAEDERLRVGEIDSILARVREHEAQSFCVAAHNEQESPEARACPGPACDEITVTGWLLVWVLRAWYGTGTGGTNGTGNDAVRYRMLPIDGACVSFLALLTGAFTEADESRVIAAKRHHREAVEAVKASKKAGGSARARRIDKGIAKREEAEASRVLAIVYATPAARELAAVRAAWVAKSQREQYVALAAIHRSALAAYREAGG